MPAWCQHVPHNNRRAAFHNYKAPCTYMISISKDPACADFSVILGKPDSMTEDPVRLDLSPVGRIIKKQICDLDRMPEFAIHNYVIMPDHVHILWQVKCWLPKDFGYYVGLFKSRCTTAWRKINNDTEEPHKLPPVFAPKFNDRIAFSTEIAARFSKYISDNPRRRQIARLYPHLFDRRRKIRILDREMDVYGNFQLLKYPLISAVIVSRRYTPEQRRKYEREWDETIRSGGVLISPFISPAEKAVMKRGIEEGASIIRLIPDGIGERYKPSGMEFDLCAQGRCLHIGAPRPSAHTPELHRAACLQLNEMARWLASHPTDIMKILKL